MTLTNTDLIAALRLRYDSYSAQTILESALAQAGIPQKDVYDATELTAFRAALTKVGDRLTAVDARLDSLGAVPTPTSDALVSEAPDAAMPETEVAPASTTTQPVLTKEPAAAALIETRITLTGVPVESGERVLMCGGLPELGDWDIERALLMVREGDRWLATLEIADGTEAPFKFVRCAADGSAVWEAGGNRSLAGSIDTTWR